MVFRGTLGRADPLLGLTENVSGQRVKMRTVLISSVVAGGREGDKSRRCVFGYTITGRVIFAYVEVGHLGGSN